MLIGIFIFFYDLCVFYNVYVIFGKMIMIEDCYFGIYVLYVLEKNIFESYINVLFNCDNISILNW